MTNYEKITRQMSSIDLATFLTNMYESPLCRCCIFDSEHCDGKCDEGVHKWLMEETEPETMTEEEQNKYFN